MIENSLDEFNVNTKTLFQVSVSSMESMCRNLYQDKRQGIENIPVTKFHRFE